MTQSNILGTILAQAKKEEWPYPKQFQALKDAGVLSYEVKVADYNAVYSGSFGTWNAPAPEGFRNLIISTKFDLQAFTDALQRRMKKEISFIEWLGQIAAAGVARYVVSMADRTVTYYGLNTDDFHVQHVPQVS